MVPLRLRRGSNECWEDIESCDQSNLPGFLLAKACKQVRTRVLNRLGLSCMRRSLWTQLIWIHSWQYYLNDRCNFHVGILAKEKAVWIEEKIDSYDYIKMRTVYPSKSNQNEKVCVKLMKLCTTNNRQKADIFPGKRTATNWAEKQRLWPESLQHGSTASLQKGKSLVFSF